LVERLGGGAAAYVAGEGGAGGVRVCWLEGIVEIVEVGCGEG